MMKNPEVNLLDVINHSKDREANNSEIEIDYEVYCEADQKEYLFGYSYLVIVEGHTGEDCDISVEEGQCNPIEETGKRSYYGFSLQGTLTCACGEDVTIINGGAYNYEEGGVIIIEDKILASEMEDVC